MCCTKLELTWLIRLIMPDIEVHDYTIHRWCPDAVLETEKTWSCQWSQKKNRQDKMVPSINNIFLTMLMEDLYVNGLEKMASLTKKVEPKRCLRGGALAKRSNLFFFIIMFLWNGTMSQKGAKIVPQRGLFHRQENVASVEPYWLLIFFWLLICNAS